MLIFYWGTKGVSTKLGYAADFCPVCRGIKVFQIIRIGKARHIYGASVGTGDLVGHNRECTKCGVVLGANPANYKEIVKRRDKMTLEKLIGTTYPNLREQHADRLKLEAFIVQHPGKLEPATRSKLLAEPFQLMEHVVQRRFAKTRIDLTMIVIAITAIFLMTQVGKIVHSSPALTNSGGNILLGIFAVACAALFLQNRRAKQKYMRESIYPVLANALRVLKPQSTELRPVLAMLNKSQAVMGRYVRLDELMKLVGKPPGIAPETFKTNAESQPK